MEETDELVLSKYLVVQLSHEDKTVRDPIHGDILWNHLETCVIDTEIFQRLRRIRQLGTTHLVFPGAEHSRFQHSLGVLHMTQTLINKICDNRFSEYRVFGQNELQDFFFKLIVRLTALLHDIHEFPLSHTLEKEGNIFPKQWEDKTINKFILGKDSEIYACVSSRVRSLLDSQESIQSYLDEYKDELQENEKAVLNQISIISSDDKDRLARQVAQTLIVFTYRLLKGDKGKINALAQELFENEDILEKMADNRFLFAGSQIVLNTVCADILDYLPRDFYFCGIDKTYDERFLKYATISEKAEGSQRKAQFVFAYRLLSKRKEIKFSVLSSLFDVLELRYTLAELVHTNRTKNAFSAMAIEAFNHYYQSLGETEKQDFSERMLKMGDDELLSFLRAHDKTSEYILDHYFKRIPYQELILCDYTTMLSNRDLHTAIDRHIKDPQERLVLEKQIVEFLNPVLERENRLVLGDCLLYMMPDPAKLYKELDTNVVYLDEDGNPSVKTLSSLTKNRPPYSPTPGTMRAVIERTISQRNNLIKKFQNLSHLSLFVAPKLCDSKVQSTIVGIMEDFFKLLHYNGISFGSSEYIPQEIHDRFVTLNSRSRRGFTTFKQLFENTE